MARYRSWVERGEIIKATIAATAPTPLSQFDLTPSEEIFYRLRAERVVAKMARQSSTFKAYYGLRRVNQLLPLMSPSAACAAIAIIAAIVVGIRFRAHDDAATMLSACVAVFVASVGWAITSAVTHNNAVRQNTTNLIFARFSQSAYTESLHAFHEQFGYGLNPKITLPEVRNLQSTGTEKQRKAASAIFYILNYFEYISVGIHKGDINRSIVEENMKGMISFYYDKCEPLILDSNKANPKAAEYLIKLRTHYRDP